MTGVPSSATHVSRTAFHLLRIQLHCRRGLRHRDNRRSGTGLPGPQPVPCMVDSLQRSAQALSASSGMPLTVRLPTGSWFLVSGTVNGIHGPRGGYPQGAAVQKQIHRIPCHYVPSVYTPVLAKHSSSFSACWRAKLLFRPRSAYEPVQPPWLPLAHFA